MPFSLTVALKKEPRPKKLNIISGKGKEKEVQITEKKTQYLRKLNQKTRFTKLFKKVFLRVSTRLVLNMTLTS